jgi:hypothetical protein
MTLNYFFRSGFFPGLHMTEWFLNIFAGRIFGIPLQ